MKRNWSQFLFLYSLICSTIVVQIVFVVEMHICSCQTESKLVRSNSLTFSSVGLWYVSSLTLTWCCKHTWGGFLVLRAAKFAMHCLLPTPVPDSDPVKAGLGWLSSIPLSSASVGHERVKFASVGSYHWRSSQSSLISFSETECSKGGGALSAPQR